ncbi:hypothetical protein [Leptolyngbya sp. 'hensonii']|uniref:hypothetical protein n=1 Tax=Leptolyngbya sp. 'hensonii' TaxID=1922337 RepID=UPI0015C57842|nr:hypothetical protein [Leptolyngbya sp. 'hensonii']
MHQPANSQRDLDRGSRSMRSSAVPGSQTLAGNQMLRRWMMAGAPRQSLGARRRGARRRGEN